MVPFIADAGRREILRPAAVVVRFIKGGPLRGNEPPFSFRLRRKENGRSRSKEKALCVQILPIRAGLDKYGGRANPCGINLPGFIRVRCVSALNGTFKPQIDASGGNLWAVNERVFAAAPCVPLRYTLRCRRSAAAPLLGAHSLPCSRSARTVSGRPHRLMKPVALVWS